jgi:methyl-accepting chemotaxis protein
MQDEANDFDGAEQEEFASAERMISYLRWPLIGMLLLFHNLGLAEGRSLVWPINIILLVAILLAGYVQYRLYQGHSFGKRVTLGLAIFQDTLITACVYSTGLYHSHFFIFYYPSLLGLSMAFCLRTSLVYTSIVGLAYSILCYFLTPELPPDPLVVQVLIARYLVMVLIAATGWFLVNQERVRRLEAVAAERQGAREEKQCCQRLNERTEHWKQIEQQITDAAEQLVNLASELAHLTGEMSSGCEGINVSVHELASRSATQLDQITAVGQITRQLLAIGRELGNSARPTGVASELAHHAVNQATEAVHALNQRSQAIGDLAAAVRQVADQTNLLAFNANIEAIQAGQKGQRFAVVANEVRTVAERAIHLAREIDKLSIEIQQGTRQVLGAMSDIAEMVNQAASLVQAASQASQDQQASADVMSQSVTSLQDAARKNATDVQMVADTVQEQDLTLQRIVMLGQKLAESANELGTLTETLAS